MSLPYGDDGDPSSSSSDYSTGVQPITSPTRKDAPAPRLTPEQKDHILTQLTVTWESLPQVPFWGPLIGQTENVKRTAVAGALNNLAVLLQRPLTTVEANAIAHHVCNARAREAYELPVVLGSAAYFTYRGRETWRFPFWTPKPTNPWFSPQVFPSIQRPFLTGAPAMRLWTFGRFTCYMAVLRFITQPLFAGWATVGYGLDILSDKRLKAVSERRDHEMKAHRAAKTGLPTQQQEQQIPTWHGQPVQQQQQTPTWPAQPEEQSDRQQPPSWRPQPQPQQKQQQETRSAFDDDSGLFDDDASPVAPSYRRSDLAPSASTSSGSSWSRLREQAKSGRGGASSPSTSPSSSSSSDSYTYSESDQEKNYAKDQAQKEFDAMLERERRSR